jgi:hypothetical protein
MRVQMKVAHKVFFSIQCLFPSIFASIGNFSLFQITKAKAVKKSVM